MLLQSFKCLIWVHPLVDHLLLLKQELLLLLLFKHSLLKHLLKLDLNLFWQLILGRDWLTIFIKVLLVSKLPRDLSVSLRGILQELNNLLSRKIICNITNLTTLKRKNVALLVSCKLLLLHLFHQHLLLLLLHLVFIAILG